jgi:hypothetical protein
MMFKIGEEVKKRTYDTPTAGGTQSMLHLVFHFAKREKNNGIKKPLL